MSFRWDLQLSCKISNRAYSLAHLSFIACRAYSSFLFLCSKSKTLYFCGVTQHVMIKTQTDVHPLVRPFPRTKPSNASSSVISSMPHHLEISRKPPLTRSTNFLSSTLRCITASRQLYISVLCVDVPGRLVGFVLLLRGNLFARTNFSYTRGDN